MDSATSHDGLGRDRAGGRLLALVDALAGRRVVVAGDLIADEFIYGEIARVSREAPVLILNYDSTEIVPGGAGNAANNVAALGGAARLAGVAGPRRDRAPAARDAEVAPRSTSARVLRPAGYRTPTKTRILAGGIHSAKQQVVRIDRAASSARSTTRRARRSSRASCAPSRGADALLVSDYGSGLVRPQLVRRRSAAARIASSAPILVDSRYALLQVPRHDRLHAERIRSRAGARRPDRRQRARARAGRARAARRRRGRSAVLITRGSRGMALFEPDRPTVHIPIVGSDQIADVTGAGDTVIATMTLALAPGATFEEAARLANYAGGLVVMKRGTATVSAERAALRDQRRRRRPGREFRVTWDAS